MTPEERLASLGMALPAPLPPRANYIAYRRVGDLLFLAGHGPRLPDNTYRVGKIGSADQIARAYADAQLTGLNMLATLKDALGQLKQVREVVKLFGMVNAEPHFAEHFKVIDGCSTLLIDVFGEAGRHARSAVGMGSLPNDMTVEIEAIFHVY
jgi:enamine deaminase RidA (YjgF/YER057c/UK114 family)